MGIVARRTTDKDLGYRFSDLEPGDLFIFGPEPEDKMEWPFDQACVVCKSSRGTVQWVELADGSLSVATTHTMYGPVIPVEPKEQSVW